MQPIGEFQGATEFEKTKAMDLNGRVRDGLWVAVTKGLTLFKTTRKCKWNELPKEDLARPMAHFDHFKASLQRIKPSVDKTYLDRYKKWTSEIGESGE